MLHHKCGFRSENKSVSIQVSKENNAEAGPLAKEKRLEEVSTEKPGKSESKRRRYQTSWEKDCPWLKFEKEENKMRCKVCCVLVIKERDE